jgi:hypothetical protein
LINDGVLIAYAEASGTEYTIPNSVTSIGGNAFSSMSLVNVNIGAGVKEIHSYAFSCCYALKSVTCKPTTPPTGGSYMFGDISSSAKIYVPTGSGEAYKTAQYWSGYDYMIEEKDM